MNALAFFQTTSIPRPRNLPLPGTARPARRERDFGVGYGTSSGYASTRRYASNWAAPRFRFN